MLCLFHSCHCAKMSNCFLQPASGMLLQCDLHFRLCKFRFTFLRNDFGIFISFRLECKKCFVIHYLGTVLEMRCECTHECCVEVTSEPQLNCETTNCSSQCERITKRSVGAIYSKNSRGVAAKVREKYCSRLADGLRTMHIQ